MMDALKNIVTRRSIRAFKAEPVSKSNIDSIMEAASNSPSYTNTQPWEVAVVTGKRKEELAGELLLLAKANAPVTPDILKPAGWPPDLEARTRKHGAKRLEIIGIKRDDKDGREMLRLMNYKFYSAPCAVFLYMDGSLGEWSIYDMGLFTQNLVLAAYAKGIDSCIQASVVDYAKEIKKFLSIPESKKMISCIAMGYPDHDAKLNLYRSIKKKRVEYVSWHE